MENTKDTMKKCIQEDNLEKKKKIQILMSTYNGEKFLREQLDSFIELENFEEIKVLVRDDGSTDNTLAILNQYKLKYGFDIVEGINVGINASFYELLNMADLSCEYFALCDQDDVWIKNKLVLAKEYLMKYYNEPALFGSKSELVDSSLKIMGETITPIYGIGFYNAMIQNVIPGHTQVMNRKLIYKLQQTKNIEGISVIDWWIYLVASGVGKIVYSDKCTVKHRQHERNSVGYKVNCFKKLKKRLIRVIRGECIIISRQIALFYENYKSDIIKDEYIDEIEKYFINQKNIFKKINYIVSKKVFRQSKIETMIFDFLYMIGRYKI